MNIAKPDPQEILDVARLFDKKDLRREQLESLVYNDDEAIEVIARVLLND